MPPEAPLQGITHTIQLAVAPVFLLSGIAALLGVFTNRLARVVDRARVLEGLLERDPGRPHVVAELTLLSHRGRLIHASLTTGTTAALLVCLLIAIAFIGYLFDFHLGTTMAAFFVLAMVALVVSLGCFLREVFIAVAHLEFGTPPEAQLRKRG
jgi:hypothetical protein